MVAGAFQGWMDRRSAAAAAINGVTIGDTFATWAEIDARAVGQAADLATFGSYVVDSGQGLDSIVALLAVCRTEGACAFWGEPGDIALPSQRAAPALLRVTNIPRRFGNRAIYGSLTSGSSGAAKLPVGYSDQLPLVGLHYDRMLYEPVLGDVREGGILATSLAPAYSAALMMAIIPAWQGARNLMLAKADRWDRIFAAAARRPVVAVTVPAMLPLACVAAPPDVDGRELTLITTAGYLTRGRIAALHARLPNIGLLSSYGASETGIMTLDPAPTGDLHMGRPLFGKAVWLSNMTEDGVGKVTTTGPDCRDYYLDGAPIRHSDGTVAVTDLGHFDAAGNLYLDGRLDAGEKLRGVTIYPRRIERHLLELDGLEDAKVQIVEGPGLASEQILATVVGDVAEGMLHEHCRSLPEFLRPSRYVVSAPDTAYTARGKLR